MATSCLQPIYDVSLYQVRDDSDAVFPFPLFTLQLEPLSYIRAFVLHSTRFCHANVRIQVLN